MAKQWNVGILLYDHVDVLDYSGPFEVFNLSVYDASQVQKLIMNQLALDEKPFAVHPVSQFGTLITTHNGLQVLPKFSIADHPKLDLLVVPGGPLAAMKQCLNNRELLEWIKGNHNAGVTIASVCTGSLLLAEASGKRATTNSLVLTFMEQRYREVEVIRDVRYVDNGDILTSAGVSAGIDLSLHLVRRFLGEQAARTTACTIEYPYFENGLT